MRKAGSSSEVVPVEWQRSSGLVISLLVVVFLGLLASYWHEKQTVDRISVIGATALSASNVKAITDSCLSNKRSTVSLADVRGRVENIAFVRNAFVYFSGIRGITVEVEERIPVAHMVMPDGTLRFVDADGNLLPKTQSLHAFDVPLLRSQTMLNAAQLASAASVLTCAQTTLESDLYNSISEVVVGIDGSVTLRTDGTTWRLGKPNVDHARNAFADMNVFWTKSLSASLATARTEIDLRWNHHIIIRNHNSQAGV